MDAASVFVENYQDLYNIVSFSESRMAQLKQTIDTKISDCCLGKCSSAHEVSLVDVGEAMKRMKAGKDEGYLSADYLLHGGSQLQVHLSYLFTGNDSSWVLPVVCPTINNSSYS